MTRRGNVPDAMVGQFEYGVSATAQLITSERSTEVLETSHISHASGVGRGNLSDHDNEFHCRACRCASTNLF